MAILLNYINQFIYHPKRLGINFLLVCISTIITMWQECNARKTEKSRTLMLDEMPKVVTCEDPPNNFQVPIPIPIPIQNNFQVPIPIPVPIQNNFQVPILIPIPIHWYPYPTLAQTYPLFEIVHNMMISILLGRELLRLLKEGCNWWMKSLKP